ncbi:MAG: helix-turn-helix transcriptional regulator [Bacteroidia bacterium]|nr:helix-turn-helix transcriptional regulator [Bacteroidia bacterium]
MLIMQLGEIIKNRRKELGITQPHLAELAKISTNTLYKLERGQGNPSLDVLKKLAEVLGMELKLEVTLPTLPTGRQAGQAGKK